MSKNEIARLIKPALNNLGSAAAAEGSTRLELAADVVLMKPLEVGASEQSVAVPATDASQQSVAVPAPGIPMPKLERNQITRDIIKARMAMMYAANDDDEYSASDDDDD